MERLAVFRGSVFAGPIAAGQIKESLAHENRSNCSPLRERPPRLYGGTERIVSYLTEELVRQGHNVTLFASGDSITSARLVPFCEVALRLDPRVKDPIPHHIVMLDASASWPTSSTSSTSMWMSCTIR